MKTLFINQQKERNSILHISEVLLICLLFFAFTIPIVAQNIIPGPILNNNPHNNTVNKVVLFEHDKFNGAQKLITQNTPNLSNFNNITTSITVPLGKRVILYETEGYQNRKITLYPGNYSHLNGWNDLARAIKIENIPNDAPVAYFLNDTGNIYTHQVFQGFGAEKVDNNSMVCYDCYSKLIVVGQLSVVAYDYRDWGGRNNEDNPFKEGEYNLADWGLDNNISSIEILNLQYALEGVYFKDKILLNEATEETVEVAFLGKNENLLKDFVPEIKVTSCQQASATETIDIATATGLSIAVTTGFTVGVEGVASGKVETEIAASFEQTITEGTSKTIVKEECFELAAPISIPPGCSGQGEMVVTPVTIQYTVERKYMPIDKDGVFIKGGIPRIVTGKVIIKKSDKAYVNASLLPGCNDPSNDTDTSNQQENPNPDTAGNNPDQGDPKPDTTDENQPYNSNNRLDYVSEIEFCDGNGNIIGFYKKDGSNWKEIDKNGNTKFYYAEISKDENSIYLKDQQREGVKIWLNFKSKEILYSDNNNTSPFKIYTITDY